MTEEDVQWGQLRSASPERAIKFRNVEDRYRK